MSISLVLFIVVILLQEILSPPLEPIWAPGQRVQTGLWSSFVAPTYAQIDASNPYQSHDHPSPFYYHDETK